MGITGRTLSDLVREHTDLAPYSVEHLKRLVAAWGVIADLCFSDLLLACPVGGSDGDFVILAQVRATTGQTLYPDDQVGRVVNIAERPVLGEVWRSGTLTAVEGIIGEGLKAATVVGPVRCSGEIVALLVRDSLPPSGRRPSPLERTYLDSANALMRMVATGSFPFPASASQSEIEQGPRVGDGTVRLDAAGKLTYASPNAVSAFHRLGVMPVEGATLAELGLDESAVRRAFTMVAPVTEELAGADATVVLGVIPLVDDRIPIGALLLLRDVSELRRKERLLLSKDATIREIHHRVKNNLQTIASLLRLQGRRLQNQEAKIAIDESVRRVRSIALVHETLSRDLGEQVPFRSIVRPLVAMVEEGLLGPGSNVTFSVEGDPGELPAEIATPLAVVVTELLQNAVEHAFDTGSEVGSVAVVMWRDDGHLRLEVRDDGTGVPAGFDLETADGLGLQIVRDLVRSEMRGTIEIADREGGGTVASLRIPLHEPV